MGESSNEVVVVIICTKSIVVEKTSRMPDGYALEQWFLIVMSVHLDLRLSPIPYTHSCHLVLNYYCR